MPFLVWNSCWHLPAVAFDTVEEAMAYTTPTGGPNRITNTLLELEYSRGSYADRAPQWFGPAPIPPRGVDPDADVRRDLAYREFGIPVSKP